MDYEVLHHKAIKTIAVPEVNQSPVMRIQEPAAMWAQPNCTSSLLN